MVEKETEILSSGLRMVVLLQQPFTIEYPKPIMEIVPLKMGLLERILRKKYNISEVFCDEKY